MSLGKDGTRGPRARTREIRRTIQQVAAMHGGTLPPGAGAKIASHYDYPHAMVSRLAGEAGIPKDHAGRGRHRDG